MRYGSFSFIILIAFVFSGCDILSKFNLDKKTTPKQEQKAVYTPAAEQSDEGIIPADLYVYTNLNRAIYGVADQLLKSNIDKNKNTRIILTTFVNLNDLEQTNSFGRIVSESMFNELHVRGFRVTDFRGQAAVNVNARGEFHITRDVDKLKDQISETEYILVGTYAAFENQSLLVNARIMDSVSGEIISSARAVFKPLNCKVYDVCEIEIVNTKKKEEEEKVTVPLDPFPIVKDK
jgi:TolB-like protein